MYSVHHEKGSVHVFFKVSIDHLFDDLESGKRNYCFGKKAGQSPEVWIQKSVRTLCYVVEETCKETLSAFHLDQNSGSFVKKSNEMDHFGLGRLEYFG